MELHESAVKLRSLEIQRWTCSGYDQYRTNCIRCGHEFDQAFYRPLCEQQPTKISLVCQVCANELEARADDSPTETPKELSARIHFDWWGKCRTCEFWDGVRDFGLRDEPGGLCKNEKSALHGQMPWSEGHCEYWDSYDYETALEVLDGKWNHLCGPVS